MQGRGLCIKVFAEADMIGIEDVQRDRIPEAIGLGVRSVAYEDAGSRAGVDL